MRKEQLFKAAGAIAVVSLISKVLGFLRETCMAAVFGASRVTDAYLVATIIPWMLFAVVSGALTMSMIPVYTRRVHDAGQEAGRRFVDALSTLVIGVCLIAVLIGMAAASPLVRLAAPAYHGEIFRLTVSLTRVLLPMMIFFGLAAVLTGYLQASERFTWPALTGIPFNLIMIMAIFLGGRRYGIIAVAVGMVLAALSQLVVLSPGLLSGGYRFRLVLDLKDPGLRQVGRLLFPIMLATGCMQLGLTVDRMMASGLEAGSISALNYGNLLTQLPLGIFSMAVNTVLYPTFARLAADHDLAGLRSSVAAGVRVTLFLIIPMMVALIALREPMVRILFERGAFDSRATGLTACAVLFFSLGLVAMGLRDMLSRVFFSLQDTITPMLIGLGAVLINAVLNYCLIQPLGLGGLALATSLSSILAVSLLFWFLRRRLDGIGGREIWGGFWRTAVAGGVMGLVLSVGWSVLGGQTAGKGLLWNAGCLGLTLLLGGVSYYLVTVFMRLPEADLFLDNGKKLVARHLCTTGNLQR